METHPDGGRTVRIRTYLNGVRDLRRSYRARVDVDIATFLKRGAIAALPEAEGWHLLVVSAERTQENEALAVALDRLANRLMDDGPDFAAALAVTTDGARAALAVTARDAAPIARLRATLVAKGRR
jgi:hypothetical protein